MLLQDLQKLSVLFGLKIFSLMYVLDTKEQIVRVKKLLSALKNVTQKECALKYWASVWLKMNWRKYTPLYKTHKIKPEQANGDYSSQLKCVCSSFWEKIIAILHTLFC